MIVTWEEWTLDEPARRLSGADGPVHVEPQVFDVLAHLVEHRDRVVSKEELLDSVWGDQFVSESALTSRIKSARRALGDDGRTQKYIRNVHGRGYQFVGDVGTAATQSEATGTSTAVSASDQPSTEELELALSIALDDEFPFVGRTDELRRIDELVDRPSATLVLLGGEPGIGKSRLAVEALGRAMDRGTFVCAGRCEEHVTYALQPIRDAVAQLAAARPTSFRSWVAGVERQVVSLVPALVGQIDVDPQPIDGYSALEVLATVIERAAAERPTMLLIDDLQWSDEPTRAFISRIGRRLADLPIGVVCTYRTTGGDLPGEVRRWIGEHARLGSSLRLDIEQFDPADVRQLVVGTLGADAGDDIDHLASIYEPRLEETDCF